MSLEIILEFLAARWYVFLIAPVYVFVMALLGKKTRFERESFQLALIFQVIYLIVYTGSALWLLAVGSAESSAYTLFTLVVNLGGVLSVLPLFLLLLYRLCTLKFLERLPNWGKNLFRLVCFVLLGVLSNPTLALLVTAYYGW